MPTAHTTGRGAVSFASRPRTFRISSWIGWRPVVRAASSSREAGETGAQGAYDTVSADSRRALRIAHSFRLSIAFHNREDTVALQPIRAEDLA